MPIAFYQSDRARKRIVLAGYLIPVAMLLAFLPIYLYRDRIEAVPLAFVLLVVLPSALVAVAVWRSRQPEVEISEEGIALRRNLSLLLKARFFAWRELEGLSVYRSKEIERSVIAGMAGVDPRVAKLMVRGDRGVTNEWPIRLHGIEDVERLIALLQEKVPMLTSNTLAAHPAVASAPHREVLRYGKFTLTDGGIIAAGRFLEQGASVPWEQVTSLTYQGQVIAGYGAVEIMYELPEGGVESLSIHPQTTEHYLDVLRYLIRHATKASIDPGLVRALEYPVSHARADLWAVGLLIGGFVLLFPALLILDEYAVNERVLVAMGMATAVCMISCMVVTARTLSGRHRGKAVPAVEKMNWAVLTFSIVPLGLLLFFLTWPASRNCALGDIHLKRGDLDAAEQRYRLALDSRPELPDALFSLGMVYRDRGDHGTAYDYMHRAYEADKKRWGPLGMELMVDELMQQERYDEALALCDELLALPHPQSSTIRKAVTRKRTEVLAAKRSHGK